MSVEVGRKERAAAAARAIPAWRGLRSHRVCGTQQHLHEKRSQLSRADHGCENQTAKPARRRLPPERIHSMIVRRGIPSVPAVKTSIYFALVKGRNDAVQLLNRVFHSRMQEKEAIYGMVSSRLNQVELLHGRRRHCVQVPANGLIIPIRRVRLDTAHRSEDS